MHRFLPSLLQVLQDSVFEKNDLHVFLKRDDLIHQDIGGNKWRKLKYNLLEAQRQQKNTLLTFGGAYSNHIYATAAAGKHFGLNTIGIIRGDELHCDSSPTLRFAASCGMELHFISRTEYRNKTIPASLGNRLPNIYPIPEGGSNAFALGGVAELFEEITQQLGKTPDFVVCPVGSGGTVAGLVATQTSTQVVGVCVLKNAQYLQEDIETLAGINNPANLEMCWHYHHGGYAKSSPELLRFIQNFEEQHQIPLDPIYTGKMLFALYDLAAKQYFAPKSTIVAVHTGLSGNNLGSSLHASQ